MQKRKKMAIACTKVKGTAPGGFTSKTLFGGRIRKNEIGEENKGSRGNLRDRKEGGCC